MYSNITTTELKKILINTLRLAYTNNNIIQDLTKLYDLIIKQHYFNYFTHEGKVFRQTEGLAMGSSSSAILSEIYLQYMEHNYYSNILLKNNNIGYFLYIDDILLIFDHICTDINLVLHEFNQINSHIQFTLVLETNRCLNFLHLIIHINNTYLDFSIFRKPAFTDTTIPFSSCHPHERKFAATRYLTNRLKTYQLSHQAAHTELIYTQNILFSNGFPLHIIPKMLQKSTQDPSMTPNSESNKTQRDKDDHERIQKH
jgi:hypothetical protein